MLAGSWISESHFIPWFLSGFLLWLPGSDLRQAFRQCLLAAQHRSGSPFDVSDSWSRLGCVQWWVIDTIA